MASTTSVTGTARIAVIALAGLLTAGDGARAQDPALCARLSAQLHDYIGDRPPTRHYQRYAMAVEDQVHLIDRTRDDLVRMGCASGSVIEYGRSRRSDCRRLGIDLKRMEAELRRLVRQRDAHAGSNGSTARQRVMAALRANGCDVPGGVRIRTTLGVDGSSDGYHDLADPLVRYRTLCVRSCDGYYFPISYSASPLDFDRDAARCSAMCPGSEAKLYFHRIPDQDSEDMVSVANQMPYASLPNAFAYRDRKVGAARQCSCALSAEPQEKQAKATPRSSILQLPAPATDGAIKPDDGSTDTDTAAAPPEQPARDIDPNRRVRVIGPTFLPDQSDAIDLRAPLPGERPEQ